MDAMSKNLSVEEAKKLINNLVDSSDIDTIERFWLIELDNLHLGIKDSETFNRVLKLKNDNTEVSEVLYNNCIKGKIIHNLLKKNWRRLFNNNIVEKYNNYIKDKQFSGDKVWVMNQII